MKRMDGKKQDRALPSHLHHGQDRIREFPRRLLGDVVPYPCIHALKASGSTFDPQITVTTRLPR